MRIETRGLKKSYFLETKEIPVLHGIDLSIKSGEFVSLIGPSGAGKSTLLHILGTLDAPSSGEMTFDGKDVFGESASSIAAFRNDNVGFVFQFHHLLPELTALENTAMPLWIRREKKYALAKAKEVLTHVGLAHRLEHRPSELSGGEQQRVALARALVGTPKLLLADEPTGNLDEATGAHVIDLMKDYAHQNHATIVVVTHNPRLAVQAGRQLVLDKNGLTEPGSGQKV